MLVQCSTWRSRAKVFFLAPFLMPVLLGMSLPAISWSKVLRAATFSTEEVRTKSSQLVQVLPRQANQPTYPNTYPMPCPQGYWCPRAELQQTSSFSQPSPPGQRALATERERAHRKARDSYTFRKRKHIWISLNNTRRISLKYRRQLDKCSKSHPYSDCQEQYDRWY